FVIMVLTFVLFEGFIEYLLARLAHRIRPWLERSGKGFNRACGGMFALMGAALPTLR
ncbi:MAG: LysE family translocator, partial [Pseudomonas sp.]